MTGNHDITRRRVLRTGAAIGTASIGLGLAGAASANPGESDASNNGTSFGRVYANGDLYRTKVATVRSERPDPEDEIYFLHDGSKPIVKNTAASAEQQSPFVSESAPGDADWNGGRWTHFSAEVTDVEAFNADAPLSTAAAVRTRDYVDVTLGRPGFGPPNYFVCPLNGRA